MRKENYLILEMSKKYVRILIKTFEDEDDELVLAALELFRVIADRLHNR